MQGLFLKRQKDVAESFARLTTEELVTMRNIMHQVINGPRGDRTKAPWPSATFCKRWKTMC